MAWPGRYQAFEKNYENLNLLLTFEGKEYEINFIVGNDVSVPDKLNMCA